MMHSTLSWAGATAIVVLGVASLAGSDCARRGEARPEHDPNGPATTSAAPVITEVRVADDRDVLVVTGTSSVRRPIIYLHGMCADPREDLDAWSAITRDWGTVIALTGDLPCPDRPGRMRWSADASRLDARLEAAVATVNASRPETAKLDADDVVLVGVSMGAARAELLATGLPGRYRRLVLIGSPQVPSPANLKGALAVVNVAGQHEAQENMRAGTRALDRAGTPTTFIELPGAVHGDYGTDGERVMSEALAFVSAR